MMAPGRCVKAHRCCMQATPHRSGTRIGLPGKHPCGHHAAGGNRRDASAYNCAQCAGQDAETLLALRAAAAASRAHCRHGSSIMAVATPIRLHCSCRCMLYAVSVLAHGMQCVQWLQPNTGHVKISAYSSVTAVQEGSSIKCCSVLCARKCACVVCMHMRMCMCACICAWTQQQRVMPAEGRAGDCPGSRQPRPLQRRSSTRASCPPGCSAHHICLVCMPASVLS